jgi:hypothetical protein
LSKAELGLGWNWNINIQHSPHLFSILFVNKNLIIFSSPSAMGFFGQCYSSKFSRVCSELLVKPIGLFVGGEKLLKKWWEFIFFGAANPIHLETKEWLDGFAKALPMPTLQFSNF